MWRALAACAEAALPVFVLGGGSNLLVSDAGFRGLVLHVACNAVRFDTDDAEKLKGLSVHLRKAGDTSEGSNVSGVSQGCWTYLTQNWGDKVEIRLTRFTGGKVVEVLPWTVCVADPKNWPQVVPLP